LVKAVVLVKSPKKLIAARLRMVKSVYDSFAVVDNLMQSHS